MNTTSCEVVSFLCLGMFLKCN